MFFNHRTSTFRRPLLSHVLIVNNTDENLAISFIDPSNSRRDTTAGTSKCVSPNQSETYEISDRIGSINNFNLQIDLEDGTEIIWSIDRSQPVTPLTSDDRTDKLTINSNLSLKYRTYCVPNDSTVEIGVEERIDPEAPLTKNANSVSDGWSIERIQPTLYVHRKDLEPLKIEFTTPEKVVSLMKSAGFLSPNRLIFIAHGFRSSVDAEWMKTMRNKLLEQKYENQYQTVILVDWRRGAYLSPTEYSQAAGNVEPVGKWLGSIITLIHRSNTNLHYYGIGHSLGAHLMGVAGRNNGNSGNSRCFDRITGLDPAGPGFEWQQPQYTNRLRASDAKFVDVIHTDGCYEETFLGLTAQILPIDHYGTMRSLGTIDFYPNYGHNQPDAGHFALAGSHCRVLDLFIWSIENPGKFRAYEKLTGDWFGKTDRVGRMMITFDAAEMGYHCSCSSELFGSYYLDTNGSEPWVSEHENSADI